MTNSRLLRFVSAILFIVAAVLLLVKSGGDLVEPLALFGLAAWVGSGAV